MWRRYLAGVLCAALLSVACASSAPAEHRTVAPPSARTASTASLREPAAPPPRRPEPDRPTSKPYRGDPSIFEHPERAERLRIERVMDLLGVEPGATVADIGAGGGWFAVRAARRVGPSGRVYAVEINPDYVEAVAARARRERLPNLHSIQGETADPRLPAGSLDSVLLLKTYHELSEPMAMMQALHRAMRPAAKLGILDRNGRGDDHGIDEAVVRDEVTRAGFSFVERYDWKSPQERVEYFLIFAR